MDCKKNYSYDDELGKKKTCRLIEEKTLKTIRLAVLL